ncbi:DUF4270 domain-containing protein [Mucilaginibacter sp. RS28]|uniref:DUF4270 domain-containing protein n=1 Tax=Mucilaginibacter straminoryzae TaxID=2932774 RepID=A0A9X1X053_9SPHI|nr:DUF4270 domain-containing protein [Mucilaginibacter straminoryzae]MCJ8208191.1 DUF4270 domain-containing protein [Mucilaginibacter straminoryzae]
MKFFRIDLLTLLISLFLFNSCKNENNIGLSIDDASQVNGTLIDTATVFTNTVPEDSVSTGSLTPAPLAYFKDPVIGTSEANIATSLNLPSSSAYTVPTGTITVDSAVLVMKYATANAFYGDSLTTRYKLNAYQLVNRPSPSTVYYNTAIFPYNSSNQLGTLTFNARPGTKIKITDIVTGKADTLKKVNPQIRVKLNTDFFKTNLFGASANALASNSLFQNQVKGLYLTLDKNQVGTGGRMFFNMDSTTVDIYYRNNTGTSIDTAVVSLPANNFATEIKHNNYTTAVKNALATTTSQEVVYLDGLVGTRAKISFPYLKNFMNNAGGNIAINRAELIVSVLPGSDIPYTPQGKLTMYRLDISKRRTYIPDAQGNLTANGIATDPRFISADVFGGYYNSVKKEYHFVITGYISDLMRGKLIDYGTYIAPTPFATSTVVSIDASPDAIGRVIAVGGISNKASANYQYRMRLNILYTKTK